MGIDLTQLLAAVTGGAQGMNAAVQQDDQRKRALALQAMQIAAHQSAMDKAKADVQHQQGEDYLKGIRQGAAPSGQAFADAGRIAGGVADAMTPSAVPIARPDVPSPFQQINASSYVDRTATPEAIQQRAAQAADEIKRNRDAADIETKIRGMVGAKLPDGTLIDERTARAMIASPSLGAAYARPTPVPKEEPNQIVQGQAPDGTTHFYRVPKNAGAATEVEGTTPKPTAGHDAETQKEQKRVALMQQGYDKMAANVAHIRPNLIAMAIASPAAGNMLLNPAEQDYLLGLRNFMAGEMHAESGARLSKDQLSFGFQRYGPQVGDKNGASKLEEARKALEGSKSAFGGGTQTTAPDVRNDAPVDPILQKYNLAPRKP